MTKDHHQAQEAVVGNLCQADKREAHTEAQEAPRAGDEGDAAHLLSLPEALGIGLFNKYIDDGQVASGIVVDLGLHGLGQGLVGHPLCSPEVPLAAVLLDIWLVFQCGAKVRILSTQWQSFVALACPENKRQEGSYLRLFEHV